MEERETHGLGYHDVDGDPDVTVLLTTMDATGRWPATQRLRAWERGRLHLAPGQRLLDVGCGLGDAAITLAGDLDPDGAIVGIDTSAEMVAAARGRSRRAGIEVRFEVGDAMALDVPDATFDAVRSERTLQWLADPAVAVGEMARVLRPGGRLALIDTDWSSFEIDPGDDRVTELVRTAMSTERNRPSHVGRRLAGLVTGARLELVDHTSATHRWSEWDPDHQPSPDGCFSMASLADDLIDRELLLPHERSWFVETVHDAARRRALRMTLTMHAVVAVTPPGGR